jgi:peptidoglycan/xylan/chitin deacetylase (PgdA/CDA1 family)
MRAILTYHSIDDSGSPVSMSEAAFRAHVRFLSSGAVTVVPLADLAARPDDAESVALTFDDAFANFATVALPLLRDHGLPATLFVVSDHVGLDNAWGGLPADGIPTLPLMSRAQLDEANRTGVDIGAHTRRHPDLTAIAASRLDDEVAGCAEALASMTGKRPRHFAYPYGAVNDRAEGAVRATFALGCTTDFRALAAEDDPFRLPRLDSWYFSQPGQLERWGTPAFRRRLWLRAQGRRVRRLMTSTPGFAA